MPGPLDPSLPLEITVDFQSQHRAAFRLFIRSSVAEPWEFLKEGVEDCAIVAPPLRGGAGLLYEFIYFSSDGREFRAALVFRQDGRMVEHGYLRVSAADGEAFHRGEVVFI